MLTKQISVVIIAKNAEETIGQSLESLQVFDEVLLYLNASSDQTEDIAKEYQNVKIVKGQFEGFGKTKNNAGSHSKNAWILSLDSDEILNEKLIEEIKQQDLSNPKNIFKLKRNNFFLGQKTQNSDYINRIYNKNFTQFNNNDVHEKVIIPSDANIIQLKESFTHLNITNINQTLTKMIHYTDLGAKNKKTCFFLIVIGKATFAFIQTYFLRFYFINGWRGFVIATSNANRRFYKYLKQYINCQNSKV